MSLDFYHNFAVALNKLSEFSQQELKDDLDKAGLIQGFEFTFEQCWKSIQKAAGSEGVRVASPKNAFSWAIEKGWISSQNETTWLAMLGDRNLTTHTYREEVANSVVANIKNNYLQAFKDLLAQMKG